MCCRCCCCFILYDHTLWGKVHASTIKTPLVSFVETTGGPQPELLFILLLGAGISQQCPSQTSSWFSKDENRILFPYSQLLTQKQLFLFESSFLILRSRHMNPTSCCVNSRWVHYWTKLVNRESRIQWYRCPSSQIVELFGLLSWAAQSGARAIHLLQPFSAASCLALISDWTKKKIHTSSRSKSSNGALFRHKLVIILSSFEKDSSFAEQIWFVFFGLTT